MPWWSSWRRPKALLLQGWAAAGWGWAAPARCCPRRHRRRSNGMWASRLAARAARRRSGRRLQEANLRPLAGGQQQAAAAARCSPWGATAASAARALGSPWPPSLRLVRASTRRRNLTAAVREPRKGRRVQRRASRGRSAGRAAQGPRHPAAAAVPTRCLGQRPQVRLRRRLRHRHRLTPRELLLHSAAGKAGLPRLPGRYTHRRPGARRTKLPAKLPMTT